MDRFRESFRREDYWIACAAIVLGALCLAKEWTRPQVPMEGWPWPEIFVASTGLVFGVVVLGGYSWARWVGLPWLAALTVMVVVDGMILKWDFGAIAAAALLPVAIGYYFTVFFPRGEE